MATLTNDITATQPVLDVTSPVTSLKHGDSIGIDDEVLRFVSYGWDAHGRAADTTVWNVERGYRDSIPTSHSAGSTITGATDAFASGTLGTAVSPFAGGTQTVSLLGPYSVAWDTPNNDTFVELLTLTAGQTLYALLIAPIQAWDQPVQTYRIMVGANGGDGTFATLDGPTVDALGPQPGPQIAMMPFGTAGWSPTLTTADWILGLRLDFSGLNATSQGSVDIYALVMEAA